MDYTLERFNLDMRKVNLFAETAYSEYAFTVEETFMDESVNDYEVEAVITEAADGLLSKIKAALAKIIESIKKFFANLVEKVKNFFAGNDEEEIKSALSKNPAIGKQKIRVPDIKEIEEVCGKRAILRKKMLAEYKKGTLTRDKFDQMKEQSDKLGKGLKTAGVVTLAIGAVVGGAFGASKLIQRLKNSEANANKDVTTLDPKADSPTDPVTVATEIASEVTEDERVVLEARMRALKAGRKGVRTCLKNLRGELDKSNEAIASLDDDFKRDKDAFITAHLKVGGPSVKVFNDRIAKYDSDKVELPKRRELLQSNYSAAKETLANYNKEIHEIKRKLGQ